MLRAVDELHATSDLTDEGWDGLVSAVGEDGVLDLLLLCGWYHAITFTARSAGVPLEEWAPTFESVRSWSPGGAA